MGYLDGRVDAESAPESLPHPNFRYGCLGDVFVVYECGENAREEGVVAVVQDRALASQEINGTVSAGKHGIRIQ